jgi:predicted transcriptional regulator
MTSSHVRKKKKKRGRPPKIDDRLLIQLIDRKNFSQAQATRVMKVTKQAVSQRLQELRGRTTKAIVMKNTDQVTSHKINAVKQLQKVNGYANEILDSLMAWQRGDNSALRVLESQVRTVLVGREKIPVQELKLKDPRELALKAMEVIKNQIKVQMEIYQTLYSLQAAEEFQRTVLEVIGEVSRDTRLEIIRRLNESKSAAQAVRFS